MTALRSNPGFQEIARESNSTTELDNLNQQDEKGDSAPMVYHSANGDIQILLHVEGITCVHCVKILETILKGCAKDGKSPIDGLIDAVGDRELHRVLIRIDDARKAPSIADQATRNLKLMGYRARPQEIPSKVPKGTTESREDLCVANVQQQQGLLVDFFDWDAHCSCPDIGVYRQGCGRHEQMTPMLAHLLATRDAFIKHSGPKSGQPEQEKLVFQDDYIKAERDCFGEFVPSAELQDEALHVNSSHLHDRNLLVYQDPLPSQQYGGLQVHPRSQPSSYAHCQQEDDSHFSAFAPLSAFDAMEGVDEDWEPEAVSYENLHQL